jgi:hypothetical protein
MKSGLFTLGLVELFIISAFLLMGVLPFYMIDQMAPKVMILGYAPWMSEISLFLWKR